jgi:hypothetical protein
MKIKKITTISAIVPVIAALTVTEISLHSTSAATTRHGKVANIRTENGFNVDFSVGTSSPSANAGLDKVTLANG